MSTAHAELRNAAAARRADLLTLLSPARLFTLCLDAVYVLVQAVIVWLFKPPPPPAPAMPTTPRARIAVVGAGLTGVSSAAHAIAHGFDVVLFEQSDAVGGIWAHVNASSGLQLNSLLYRFHPGVLWARAFPQRDDILAEIRRIWDEYHLAPRTRLGTRVSRVRRAPADKPGVSGDDIAPSHQGHARWVVNDGADGVFDAVIVTIGTCGPPRRISFPGIPQANEDGSSDHDGEKTSGEQDTFRGKVLHSSELDGADLEGRRVVVIGSGASGVEAVEAALARGAQGCVIVARADKAAAVDHPAEHPHGHPHFGPAIRPRDALSFIWERIVTWWNYRGVEDLVPAHLGLFEGTPVVNDEFLGHVRKGSCRYIRGDTQRLSDTGVCVSVRGRESKPGDEGQEEEFPADVVVLATGFEKPDVGFLEEDLFPEGYERPNLYLQNFATEDWSVLMTNSAYTNAIGTVGHFHIGIYTRILLTFLMDRDARPLPKDMKLWVDVLRFVKRGARGGALGFFTYMELTIWLVLFHLFRLDRLRWLFFIMQGWGVYPDEYKRARKGGAGEGAGSDGKKQ
ncbi:FAD/NAD(P)-binding domain-containing protein [Amylocystis lapponica]|nr:FAD/NAD(P)-binding domain-containing protein [Amylocystis lapponica]